MNGTGDHTYFLGHSDAEVERLALQSAFYRDSTETTLRRAGLASGMRVLDIGCGGGDVSLLAAELVGPSGFVLGIDRSVEAVAAASRRAKIEKIEQVQFLASELDKLPSDGPFDALIGRFVLMYLPDPAATLRMLSRHLRSDGIVAFQEMEMRSARGYPDAPLFQRCIDLYATAIERAGFESGMGGKLFAAFESAGLPLPQMIAASRSSKRRVSSVIGSPAMRRDAGEGHGSMQRNRWPYLVRQLIKRRIDGLRAVLRDQQL